MRRRGIDDVIELRDYLRKRRPAQAADRPTRREIAADRQRTDYRLRAGLLRAPGTPPTAEYKRARAALEAERAAKKDTREHPA